MKSGVDFSFVFFGEPPNPNNSLPYPHCHRSLLPCHEATPMHDSPPTSHTHRARQPRRWTSGPEFADVASQLDASADSIASLDGASVRGALWWMRMAAALELGQEDWLLRASRRGSSKGWQLCNAPSSP